MGMVREQLSADVRVHGGKKLLPDAEGLAHALGDRSTPFFVTIFYATEIFGNQAPCYY